jgi:L-ascorbate metabolism protein UlaG (beta-lactamase superfamily)
MHYGANPLTNGKPEDFVAAMKGSPVKVIVMTEGQTVEF